MKKKKVLTGRKLILAKEAIVDLGKQKEAINGGGRSKDLKTTWETFCGTCQYPTITCSYVQTVCEC